MADRDASKGPHVAVLGAGRVGSVLAVGLHRAGWRVSAVWNRHPERAEHLRSRIGTGKVFREAGEAAAAADAVFLTVADDAVGPLAVSLVGGKGEKAMEGKVVFHTSGVLTAAVLGPVSRAGARVGALHPLQTFAGVDAGIELLGGIRWAVDGDGEALALAGRVVRTLGGRLLEVPGAGRVFYHAAAVVASNYLVVLAAEACRLMAASGVEEEEAMGALLPLMEGTLHNLRGKEPERALTGPVARGDADTVRRHLEAVEPIMPEAARFYRALAERCLALSEKNGLESGLVEAVRRVLSDPEKNPSQLRADQFRSSR